MADETLKLPKPLLGNEIRNDFLTFPPDRRWDLLGFIKSDEVEEIKSCDVGPDGHRYYLVHWKESWKPESSLVYCEKLLQDFWSKRSILHENEVLPLSANIDNDASNASPDKPANCENSEPTLNQSMLLEDSENQGEMDPLSNDDDVMDTAMIMTTQEMKQSSKDVPQNLNVTDVLEVAHIPEKNANMVMVMNSSETKSCDLALELATQETITPLMHDDKEVTDTNSKDENVSDHEDIDIVVETPENVPAVDDDDFLSTKDDVAVTTTSCNDTDSPSKKGAPKRKARPPRQSMHSLGTKAALAKKKEKLKKAKIKKIKEKAKSAKNSRAAASIMKSNVLPPVGNPVNIVNDENSSDPLTSNLKCMVCDKFLSSRQNLMKHLLTHNNNHTCPICQKTFKSTHFLKHHMDIHNASYQYTCPICDKKFKFKNNMRGHIRKHNMEKKFECEICQKKFIGRYNLKEHMKSHSDVRPYTCDFCTKAYKDRGALNKHLLTHQEKRVECEICKRPFTNMKQVKRHMQFHYSWPGDSYKRKSNIGPDGEKMKFKCPHCDKAFNHYSNMNAHVHKKHKERKIQCTNCPKTFAYQYELREHMFIHLGGQGSKFKCQFCDKSFQRSTTLKNHERTTHLGIKRFKCDICGKMFGTKFNMKVHVEKLHNDNPNEEIKPRRARVIRNDRHHINENDLMESFAPTDVNTGLPVSLSNVNVHQHPLLRNINTSDIIRNAMAHIPELNYFPPLPGHPPRYQFYGMPQTDFSVSETAMV